jgi:ATP-dependent Clp protease ATP-binding subunit ClpB
MVDEPDLASSISILRGLKERYEMHHNVRIMDDAIIAAVELSHRYITDRFLPDKAIDLIDEAASKLRLEMNSVPEDIDELQRDIKQLEIEKEAIKREGNKLKIDSITKELSEKNPCYRRKWPNGNRKRPLLMKYKQIKNKLKTLNYKLIRQKEAVIMEKWPN